MQDMFKGPPSDTFITSGRRPLRKGRQSETFLFVLLKASSIPGEFTQEISPTDWAVVKYLNQLCSQCKILRSNKVRSFLTWVQS